MKVKVGKIYGLDVFLEGEHCACTCGCETCDSFARAKNYLLQMERIVR